MKMSDTAHSTITLKTLVSGITRLPSLPANIQKINRMIDAQSVTAQAIGKEIAEDMALAGSVLKLVNSGFYGVSNKVSSISHAVVMLGVNVLGGLVNTAWASSTIADSFAGLYDHSLACSKVCYSLARNLGCDDQESLTSAGLLHDIGKVVLTKHLPSEYEEVSRLVKEEDLRFHEAETRALGVTHADIGVWLLKKWNIPEATIAPIRSHHKFDPSSNAAKNSGILILADIIVKAEAIGWSGDDLLPEIDERVMQTLSLDPTDLRFLMDDAFDEIRDMPRVERQIDE
jgi:putative nucleotidyltransferase with HDIG domain